MKVNVTLKFDEKKLGEKWLNPDNLKLLLYSDNFTNDELLKVVKYEEIKSNRTVRKKRNS